MKIGAHVYVILTKFRNNWVKIVDFLIKAHFWSSPHSPIPQCTPNLLPQFHYDMAKFELLDFIA